MPMLENIAESAALAVASVQEASARTILAASPQRRVGAVAAHH